ncbi:hypothetical protein DEALK_02540 [Dehalogenimonas alkenigignens]|uniref:HdeD family acid-resistance protein n=1 Tax=Dehalogenimonas alkenigignens TaxID=1217799 RepID=A0A0W0GLA1_9CHLR|nr:HdeD family acid-resistance protein [Dehalogenimonas alkenigignens]KTB49341.1 hypothetical protein DEALK_02540 [Dehalogenimonas alkenigignens]
MLSSLSRNWWLLALRGIAAIIFGVLALVWPSLTVLSLVVLFGALAFVEGVFSITTAIAVHKKNEYWWAILLAGVAGIIIGLITFFWPDVTALALLYLIASWALITGGFEIAAAIKLRKLINNEWVMILGGLLSILVGVLLVVFPGAGALSVIWLIGSFAIAFGILQIVLAFKVKSLAPQTHD